MVISNHEITKWTVFLTMMSVLYYTSFKFQKSGWNRHPPLLWADGAPIGCSSRQSSTCTMLLAGQLLYHPRKFVQRDSERCQLFYKNSFFFGTNLAVSRVASRTKTKDKEKIIFKGWFLHREQQSSHEVLTSDS